MEKDRVSSDGDVLDLCRLHNIPISIYTLWWADNGPIMYANRDVMFKTCKTHALKSNNENFEIVHLFSCFDAYIYY